MDGVEDFRATLPLCLGLAACLVGCAAASTHAGELRTVEGSKAALFGATVSTWARLDADGRIVEAGVTLPYAVIENAPAEADHHAAFAADAVVEFPEEVQQATFLNHLGLFWAPHGHEPEGRYSAPHFDFHFFGVTAAEAAAVDCTRLDVQAPELVPAGWLPAVPPGADPRDFCVPLMGFHLVPETEFVGPGEWQPGLFDMVMIGGEYASTFTFFEPMITKAALARKESFSLPVPVPEALGWSTLYPTRFEAVYDPADDVYQLILSGFEPIA